MSKINKQLLSNIFIILIIVAGLIWVCSRFIHLGNVEFTDNAQVRQHIVPVNSRVQGFIKKIYFSEYQIVHKGDTLAIIEDAEFRLRVAQAEADYQNALVGKTAMGTSISTTRNNLSVSDAGIEEMKILLQNAEKDYLRYQKLLAEESVTQQQYDGVKTNYDAMKAKYEMLVRQKQSTVLVKDEQTQRLSQNEAAIAVTLAALDLSKLNLSYTVIIAPCDGVTSRKAIQDGQLVQIGQTLLSVVDESEKWVIANYKETQTAHIEEGMEVEMKIDAIPGVMYKGCVQSVSMATGAQFSIVPQDNSAGNFVKVEQRVPVKIVFSDENSPEAMQKLRAGLNVECKVNYKVHARN
ncbi:MAG: HlyD family secretion protein [Prevotellaceae bacterium]|jgi:membrane fusion protein (multidrug efflux system)|nr:HlyD family secretion protein [Prevotellaceae bacterium]